MDYKDNTAKTFESTNLLWQLSVAGFIVAALTGFAYRLGLTGVDLWGLSIENIRHAHSHLMFFCWAVPLPMYFMLRKTGRNGKEKGGNTLMSRMALGTIFLGFASYPFFLFYGYRPVPVAGMELPFSVILSGLVMLCWYGFMAGYWNERNSAEPDISQVFFDGALIMLFISSLGAWGVAVVQFAGFENPLYGKALTHFFLATFTEGWVVMVLLGLLYQKANIKTGDLLFSPGILAGLILFGAPLTFPYGISESLLTPQLLMAARAGGLLAAAGLALNLYELLRSPGRTRSSYVKVILVLLALKVLAQLLASVLPSDFWMSAHGLRIFYLHLLLLGAFSLGLFTFLAAGKSNKGLASLTISVLLVLLSLVWLTPMWPRALFASWQFTAIAAIALLPSLAAIYFYLGQKQAAKMNQ